MVHCKRFLEWMGKQAGKLELEDRGSESEAVAWRGVRVCR